MKTTPTSVLDIFFLRLLFSSSCFVNAFSWVLHLPPEILKYARKTVYVSERTADEIGKLDNREVVTSKECDKRKGVPHGLYSYVLTKL